MTFLHGSILCSEETMYNLNTRKPIWLSEKTVLWRPAAAKATQSSWQLFETQISLAEKHYGDF